MYTIQVGSFLKKNIFFICLFFSFFGNAFAEENIFCSYGDLPVCAKVKCTKVPCSSVFQTFSNRCVMEKSNLAEFVKNGPCESTRMDCPTTPSFSSWCKGGFIINEKDNNSDCPVLRCIDCRINSPICGIDGKDYKNECLALKNKIEVAFAGKCNSCIKDRQIIPSSLVFRGKQCCDGLKVCTKSGVKTCKKDCLDDPCPIVYHPVCGSNYKSYGNKCLAAKSNVNVLYDGKCRDCVKEGASILLVPFLATIECCAPLKLCSSNSIGVRGVCRKSCE